MCFLVQTHLVLPVSPMNFAVFGFVLWIFLVWAESGTVFVVFQGFLFFDILISNLFCVLVS